MVNNVLAKQKRYSKNLRKIIPVVASTYVLNDNAYAAPEGITELIDATNELMPEGIKASESDIAKFKLNFTSSTFNLREMNIIYMLCR